MLTGLSLQAKAPFIPKRLIEIGYHVLNISTVLYLNEAYVLVLIDVSFKECCAVTFGQSLFPAQQRKEDELLQLSTFLCIFLFLFSSDKTPQEKSHHP